MIPSELRTLAKRIPFALLADGLGNYALYEFDKSIDIEASIVAKSKLGEGPDPTTEDITRDFNISNLPLGSYIAKKEPTYTKGLNALLQSLEGYNNNDKLKLLAQAISKVKGG